MATIDVVPLTGYDRELEQQLGNEYRSPWEYAVPWEQSARGTLFTLVKREFQSDCIWRDASTDGDIGWLSSIAGSDGLSFVAMIEDTPVGVIICERQRWNNIVFIRYLYVGGAHRRRGVGTALMQTLEEAAQQAGFRGVMLETQSKNGAAIDYYRAMGFDITGINTRYYTNDDIKRGDVALFLHKPL